MLFRSLTSPSQTNKNEGLKLLSKFVHECYISLYQYGEKKLPFYFQNGQTATNILELYSFCVDPNNSEECIKHLKSENFENWLSYIGETKLADTTKNLKLKNIIKYGILLRTVITVIVKRKRLCCLIIILNNYKNNKDRDLLNDFINECYITLDQYGEKKLP